MQIVPRRFCHISTKMIALWPSKYAKIRFRPGLRPGPRWGSSRRSPRPLVGWSWGHPFPYPTPLGTNPPSALAMRPPPEFQPDLRLWSQRPAIYRHWHELLHESVDRETSEYWVKVCQCVSGWTDHRAAVLHAHTRPSQPLSCERSSPLWHQWTALALYLLSPALRSSPHHCLHPLNPYIIYVTCQPTHWLHWNRQQNTCTTIHPPQ